MLQCLAGQMALDGARVLLIDTDPQKSTLTWAEDSEEWLSNNNLTDRFDVVELTDEEQLEPILDAARSRYDAIFVDTAGFASQMATYIIQDADLILIPTGSSKKTNLGATKVFRHIERLSSKLARRPSVFVALWNVKPNTNVFRHAKEMVENAKLPLLSGHVASRTGFEAMDWTGGLPVGASASEYLGFVGALQQKKQLSFYQPKPLKEAV